MHAQSKPRSIVPIAVGLAAVAAILASATCLADDSSTSTTGGNTAPSVVGFRLDDLQNGWCEAQQQAVINLFLSKNVPLTIGIIGNRFQVGSGTGMTSFLTSESVQSAIKSGLIEVANHSFTHPDGAMTQANGWNKESVQDDLAKCVDVIKSGKILDVAPSVFIAPDNDYDSMTESGAVGAGITTMSAQCDVNPGGNVAYCPGPGAENVEAPNLKDQAGINQVAAGAVLESWTNYQAAADLDAAKGWAQRQIARQGFSVFMLHPQEFSKDDGCATFDQDKLDALGQLLDDYTQAGARLETLSGVVKAVAGG